MYSHKHTHTHRPNWMVCVYMYVCVYIHVFVCVCINTCTYACVQTYICMYGMRTDLYMHVCMYRSSDRLVDNTFAWPIGFAWSLFRVNNLHLNLDLYVYVFVYKRKSNCNSRRAPTASICWFPTAADKCQPGAASMASGSANRNQIDASVRASAGRILNKGASSSEPLRFFTGLKKANVLHRGKTPNTPDSKDWSRMAGRAPVESLLNHALVRARNVYECTATLMLLKRSIAETSLDTIHQIEESDEENAKCACFGYFM